MVKCAVGVAQKTSFSTDLTDVLSMLSSFQIGETKSTIAKPPVPAVAPKKMMSRKNSRPEKRKSVKLLISNLALSVVSQDLRDLFEPKFRLFSVAVNCNQHGESLGTATITMRKGAASKLIRKSSEIKLDGMTMKFAVVEFARWAKKNEATLKRSMENLKPE